MIIGKLSVFPYSVNSLVRVVFNQGKQVIYTVRLPNPSTYNYRLLNFFFLDASHFLGDLVVIGSQRHSELHFRKQLYLLQILFFLFSFMKVCGNDESLVIVDSIIYIYILGIITLFMTDRTGIYSNLSLQNCR